MKRFACSQWGTFFLAGRESHLQKCPLTSQYRNEQLETSVAPHRAEKTARRTPVRLRQREAFREHRAVHMKNAHYNTLSQNTRTPSRRLAGLPGLPALIRKPLSVVLSEAQQDTLVRHLTLFDLVVVGVAGTVGSGIFAIVGLVGSVYAGPAGIISWLLAAVGCTFSGLSYAELSSVIPSEGGAYAYAFVALGELPAMITAWCLTLEFGVSGAAVGRVWADKILEWVTLNAETSAQARFWAVVLNPIPRLGFSPLAAALQGACVFVLLKGVKVGKRITTLLTAIKMAVCAFIVITGLGLFDTKNMVPFAPTGIAGIVRGSSAAFFGYLGYDEVCALSGEAINPRRDVPLSIAIILAIVSVTYVLAATALSGMVPTSDEDPNLSFVMAFSERGWDWAGQVVAVGELVSLPVVVLASFLVQPRLLFVLASDGLLPKSLAKANGRGVLKNATLISGFIMVFIAAIAPFRVLDDFISAGMLLCFAITNSCAIVMRRSNLDPILPGPCRPLVIVFNGLCFATGLLVRIASSSAGAHAHAAAREAEGREAATRAAEATAATAAAILFLAAWFVMIALSVLCPELPHPLGGTQVFRAPFSPWTPSLGIAISWLLMAQLSWASLQCTLLGILAVCAWYFTYGISHSVGQKSRTWPQLAALSAAAAAEGGDPEFMSSPVPRITAYNPRKLPSSMGGGSGRARRPNLRATFAGTPPRERSASPARGAGGGGGEGQGLAGSAQEEGYLSFAALSFTDSE